jgi:hypothetical protein
MLQGGQSSYLQQVIIYALSKTIAAVIPYAHEILLNRQGLCVFEFGLAAMTIERLKRKKQIFASDRGTDKSAAQA